MIPELIREFEDVFFEFDRDGDGFMDIKELKRVMEKLYLDPTD